MVWFEGTCSRLWFPLFPKLPCIHRTAATSATTILDPSLKTLMSFYFLVWKCYTCTRSILFLFFSSFNPLRPRVSLHYFYSINSAICRHSDNTVRRPPAVRPRFELGMGDLVAGTLTTIDHNTNSYFPFFPRGKIEDIILSYSIVSVLG